MLCVCIFETMESKCVLSVFVCCSTLSHYKLDVKVDRSVIIYELASYVQTFKNKVTKFQS